MPEAVQPQGSDATGASGTAKPENADAGRYEKLETMMQTLQHQLNGLSAAQRAATKKEAEQAPPTETQNVTLKSLRAELDQRDAKIRARAINTEIDSFCKEEGIPEDMRPFFKSYVKDQHSGKLSTAEDDQVMYEDEFGEKSPFKVLGKKILAAHGMNLIPSVQTPGAVGGRSQGGANRQPSVPESMTMQQMLDNPAAADAMMRAKAQAIRFGGTIRT